MEFRATFCDPFNPNIIDLGPIEKDEIINKFKSVNFREYLELMKKAKESDLHFSPSLEIENKTVKAGLAISAVEGSDGEMEYYTFFKRPKTVRKFFGLIPVVDENYLSDFTLYTEDEVVECLKALIENDLAFLEKRSRRR